MAPVSYVEAINQKTGESFYIEGENEADIDNFMEKVGFIGPSVEGTTVAFPENNTYVFRKMSEAEFRLAQSGQKMPLPLRNPATGEKWLTEGIEHSQAFHNRGVTDPEVVGEFAIDKKGYGDIRGSAIDQQGSKRLQPTDGSKPFNIKNTERLGNQSDKINIGLKGKQNIDDFNRHVVKVSKIDPNSFVNKNQVLRWIRRHKIQTAGIFIGVAIDAAQLTISLIEDEGTFGKSTQISLGEIAGGLVGAEAAIAIGAQIGAALGSIVPVWGNIILGFIGGMIGALVGGGLVQLARYLFGVAPAAPGPGAPMLDTDPYPTYTGVPGDGMNTGTFGVPGHGLDTGAMGVPSLGMDTGATGTPESEYNTRRM